MLFCGCNVTACCFGCFAAVLLGAVTADLMGENCFYNAGRWNEGCNWLYEGSCPDIDFVSIHTWADQWRQDAHDPGDWLK